MKTYWINVEDIDNILEKVGNHFFSVQFKKSDGSIRNMQVRFGVTRHLKGGESTIKNNPNLVGVYDINNGYRCFSKDRVIKMRINGNTYRITKENNDDQ